MRRALLLSLTLFTVAAGAAPASGVDSLRHFFSNVNTVNARFKQVVLDEALNTMQESSGTLWIARPNRFRWNYDAPFEQEIVSNGTTLWMYDKPLKQVTTRPMAGSLGYTPAVLLAGKGRLEDNFTLKSLGKQGNLEWAELVPRSDDGGFQSIRIGFDGGKLRVLEMVDGFGNTTRVTLEAVKENAAVDAARFEFKVPEGVDVLSAE